MMKSGEFEALYKKWFQSPIPPKGINLNAPMSKELRRQHEAAERQAGDMMAPTLPAVAAPRGGAAGLGSGPAAGRPLRCSSAFDQ